jgi:DNA-binding protein HU-beta
MSGRIEKSELAKRVAKRISSNPQNAEELVDAVFEEIYEALKQEERVSIRNFGTFYIENRRNSTVFKFNPSQRLKALFGWSSTYKGDL